MRGTLPLFATLGLTFAAGCPASSPIAMKRLTQLGSSANTVPSVVFGLTPLADGTALLACEDRRVRLWDPESGSIRWDRPIPVAVSAMAGAPIATAAGGTIAVVSARSPETGAVVVDPSDAARTAALDGALVYVNRIAAGGSVVAMIGDNQGSKIDLDAPAESILEIWDLAAAPKKLPSIRAATTQADGSPAFSSVAVSPDGRFVATGSHDGRIAVRDLTGKVLASWKAHGRFVDTLAFSPDGGTIVSADESETAWWNASSGAAIRREFAAGHVPGLSWSPDGRQIADGLSLVDVASGTRRALEGFEQGAYASAFLAGGKRIAFAGREARIRVFDRESAKEISPAGTHCRAVASLSFSPDGSRIATTGGDGQVLVFTVADGTLVATHECDGVTGPEQGTAGAGILADGKTLLAGGASGLHSLDGAGGVASAWNRIAAVEAFALSPDRTRAALGDGAIVDTATGAEVARFVRSTAVLDLAFSRDGKLLAIGSTDDAARLVDAATGAEKSARKHSGWVQAVAVSPSGALTSAASGEKRIVLSDGFFGKKIATPADATSLDWRPDGRTLAAAAGSALLFDAKGRLVATLPGTERAQSVAFSPDGTLLAVGMSDGTTVVFRYSL